MRCASKKPITDLSVCRRAMRGGGSPTKCDKRFQRPPDRNDGGGATAEGCCRRTKRARPPREGGTLENRKTGVTCQVEQKIPRTMLA